jgi:hypothetical protein
MKYQLWHLLASGRSCIPLSGQVHPRPVYQNGPQASTQRGRSPRRIKSVSKRHTQKQFHFLHVTHICYLSSAMHGSQAAVRISSCTLQSYIVLGTLCRRLPVGGDKPPPDSQQSPSSSELGLKGTSRCNSPCHSEYISLLNPDLGASICSRCVYYSLVA